MYARVAAATGWTFEYIGQCLTLPRLAALYAHWNEYPPMHEAYAIVHGFGKPAAATAKPISNEDVVRNLPHDPRVIQWTAKAANGR